MWTTAFHNSNFLALRQCICDSGKDASEFPFKISPFQSIVTAAVILPQDEAWFMGSQN